MGYTDLLLCFLVPVGIGFLRSIALIIKQISKSSLACNSHKGVSF